jgi:hypothetical protein
MVTALDAPTPAARMKLSGDAVEKRVAEVQQALTGELVTDELQTSLHELTKKRIVGPASYLFLVFYLYIGLRMYKLP